MATWLVCRILFTVTSICCKGQTNMRRYRKPHYTFCCSSASLFCCTITTRYSSHCFWNCATLVLASSSSIDIDSTWQEVFININFQSPCRDNLTLPKNVTEFFKENMLHCIPYDKRVISPSVNNLINIPRLIPWLWCRQFCPNHFSACWLHLLALFSSPEAN